MYNKLTSITNRVFFILAFLLLFLAIWEKIVRYFDYTISCIPYEPARLLEFSVIFLIFVITLLLRQIREELKSNSVMNQK